MTPAELRAGRRALGLTQSALAGALGVTANTIARWERGEVPIRSPKLVGLALDRLAQVAQDQTQLAAASHNNLPAQLTSFIGRYREVTEVRRVLASARLLTLTGPPGAGKTRLALEVAANALTDYRHGVTFVSLAQVRDPDALIAALAGMVGVRETTDGLLREDLVDYLRDRQLLLVLDNFEHVLPAAPTIVELLTQCAGLTALVTSRVVLRVSGEHTFIVPPLALPDLTQRPTVEQLAQYEAVRLFADRARSATPEFAITAANARAVAEICCRLDGLPLPIELAAARTRLLAPQALLARLEQRLALLTEGGRDLPPRQRTLRSAIDWSHTLLHPVARRVFRRLAAFAGSCGLESAEAVCGAGMSQDAVMEGLASLVDASLVRRVEQQGVEVRLQMLETIREYALDELVTCGEAEALRQRHAEYFLALAEQAEQGVTGPDQTAWLDRLEREHDNLRVALRSSLDHGWVETALRLGAALWRFWYPRGYLREGQTWLAAALASPGASSTVRARALNAAGNLAERTGDLKRATTLYEASLHLRRSLADRPGVAQSVSNLGLVAQEQGDYARAVPLYEEGLAVYRALGEQRHVATLLNNLGLVMRCKGELEQAATLLDESLALCTELQDRHGSALVLLNIARIERDHGEYQRAAALCRKSFDFWHETGDRWGIAATLEILAQCASGQGQLERAGQLFGAAEALRDAIGTPLPTKDLRDISETVEMVRATLGDAVFLAAQALGRAMPLDALVAYALAEEPDSPTSRERVPDATVPQRLTPREREVVRLMVEGMTNREIAERLVVSERTVDAHLDHVRSKLRVNSRVQVAAWAVAHGLSPTSPT